MGLVGLGTPAQRQEPLQLGRLPTSLHRAARRRSHLPRPSPSCACLRLQPAGHAGGGQWRRNRVRHHVRARVRPERLLGAPPHARALRLLGCARASSLPAPRLRLHPQLQPHSQAPPCPVLPHRYCLQLQPDCVQALAEEFAADGQPVGVLGSRFFQQCADLQAASGNGGGGR